MRAKPGSGPQRRSEPHPVDIHPGSRLRQRRTAKKLAATLGITYQQVQSTNTRAIAYVPAGSINSARTLSVPVTFFLEGMRRRSRSARRRADRDDGSGRVD